MASNGAMETTQSGAPSDPVLGVTLYDRVVSSLLSVMITTGATTAALGVTWWANRPASKAVRTTPVTAIDVDLGEDWGGVRDGSPGESWDVVGPESREPFAGGDG